MTNYSNYSNYSNQTPNPTPQKHWSLGHWELIRSIRSIRLIFVGIILSFIFHSNSFAISPTPKLSPTASPSGSVTPTSTEDEKVKDIREAINQKVKEIKEKIEKKAFVGSILEITDSTISVGNFRGKRRIRLLEETKIIGTDKKEIKANELAVEDKIIALGEISENEILEAKRVIVVPKPKSPVPKRLVINAKILEINNKKSILTVTSLKNLDEVFELKIDKTTNLVSQKDPKATLKLKDLTQEQRIIAVYPEPAEGKPIIAKTIFLLL